MLSPYKQAIVDATLAGLEAKDKEGREKAIQLFEHVVTIAPSSTAKRKAELRLLKIRETYSRWDQEDLKTSNSKGYYVIYIHAGKHQGKVGWVGQPTIKVLVKRDNAREFDNLPAAHEYITFLLTLPQHPIQCAFTVSIQHGEHYNGPART